MRRARIAWPPISLDSAAEPGRKGPQGTGGSRVAARLRGGSLARRGGRYLPILTLLAMLSSLAALAVPPPPDPFDVVDFAQCANGKPPSTSVNCPDKWINGALNSNNSHYREDDAVGQRAVFEVPQGAAATGSVSFEYLVRKGTHHAYDSLTTIPPGAQAVRCQDLNPTNCPEGTADTEPIPPDPNPVQPVGPGEDPTTSAHELPGGVMTMYGGTIPANGVSVPVHSAPDAQSEIATITVGYQVTDANNDTFADAKTVVMVLFGGHLAVGTGSHPRGWGDGLGASDISGGPYHIRFEGRDNQIMSNAILPLAALTISKSVSPTSANVGQQVTYTITITNSGSAAGTVNVVDDYDQSHITPSNISDGGVSNGDTITWTNINVPANSSKNLTYTGTVIGTFSTGEGTGGCGSGQFPVVNTATLSTGGSASATLCVNAGPAFTVTKTADRQSSTIGGIANYTITVTNTGTASGTTTTIVDTYDKAHVDVSNISPNTGVNDTTAGTITWPAVTLAPGASASFSYTATFKGTFTTDPDPTTCPAADQFGVVNTVRVSGQSANETVCITGAPLLRLAKSASASSVVAGDTITYTLDYSNQGTAPATNVVITESIPAGTEFASCTPDCGKNGPPVTTVTWNVGDVQPGGSGSVTLSVTVLSSAGCQICNTASISAANNPTTQSNQVCVNNTPGPNPALAHANGDAFGAHVEDPLNLINATIPSGIATSQTGVGSQSKSDELLSVSVLPALTADVLRASSTSTVTASPAEARQLSDGEAVKVNVLTGLVTADLVRAVASTTATGSSASYSAIGSTLVNVRVQGVLYVNVAPNTKITLPKALFGNGSYVALNEQNGSTSGPAAGQLSGGTYSADLEVNMIRVHVTDTLPLIPGNQTTDVTVAHAKAHSDFPQTTLCAGAPTRAVSGHAFIASEHTSPNLLPVVVGFVEIPSTGGSANQQLLQVRLPEPGGQIVSADASDSSSTGTLGSPTTASSYAQVADVCVLKSGAVCTVSATLVKSQANSSAGAGGASSNDTGTQLIGIKISGTDVCQLLGLPTGCTPPRNSVINLDGLGFVVLNEQFCDAPGTLPNCAGSTHTGRTVRAIRVVVTLKNLLNIPVGAEVIVAEAHSDATFIP